MTMNTSYRIEDGTGVAALSVALPSLAMELSELAALRGVDPAKYAVGLGCRRMALCAPDESAVTLGVRAARGALEQWGGDLERIGMIVVGTETALDMSRPLSAFVAQELGLEGRVRSYEVKHACYAGTLALRQALEWRWSGSSRGKAALVVAADQALYAPSHPGEPTQGAAAVAMVVDDARIFAVDRASYAWSRPAFDFWRPVGAAYPEVDGPLSLDCYRAASASTFVQWHEDAESPFHLDEAEAFAFHTPFPRMVEKGFVHACEAVGRGADASALFERLVAPALAWNREVGNCYTASAWVALACALAGTGATRAGVFSYGSGAGAELLTLERRGQSAPWRDDVERQLATRELIDGASYAELRRVR